MNSKILKEIIQIKLFKEITNILKAAQKVQNFKINLIWILKINLKILQAKFS